MRRDIQRKINLAEALNGGACTNGTYAEGIIILCSIISAVAAELWPGRKIDRPRFIETIVRYSTPQLIATRISLFLLYQSLLDSKKLEVASQLKESFWQLSEHESCRIFIADEIDQDETDIRKAVPSIELSDIRSSSYASIVYEKLRCDLAHQYQLNKYATSRKMTSMKADISYTNVLEDSHTYHEICISFDWVKSLTESIVDSTVSFLIAHHKNDFPDEWWIDGGALDKPAPNSACS